MNLRIASNLARNAPSFVKNRFGPYLIYRNISRSYPLLSSPPNCFPKPFYVTTPIFYVNDAPHIGHLYTMILADIFKRWNILKGNAAILCTGTDEHGMKVQQAASRAGALPKEFCDSMSETFKVLAEKAKITNDHFIRTTDPVHTNAVQYFWTILKDKGLIYESKHEGWYCISDETFYPENTIEKRIDPLTGRTFMASQETGKEVEWTSERNYHFRLSSFKEPLLEFYKSNPNFIVPAERMKEVVAAVSTGLQDLSISRPTDRLNWGVRVPDDESQCIYVWLDALVNYITAAKFPWPPKHQQIGGWPANLHVIGKDITRFHCIYWPAFLLAAGLKPPKQILTHAHWTLGKQKMAKSTGNTVNPFFAMDRFGVDVIRYYLAHDGGILNDSDYGNQNVVVRYKKDLEGGIGNLLFRLTRPLAWNVRYCVKKFENKTIGSHLRLEYAESMEQKQLLQELFGKVSIEMEKLSVKDALRHIMNVVYHTNTYFQQTKPWELVKSQTSLGELEKSVEASKNVVEIIYLCAEALRIVGILMQAYMPDKAKELLDILHVDVERRSIKFAKFGKDFTYGNTEPTKKSQMLFPPLPVEN